MANADQPVLIDEMMYCSTPSRSYQCEPNCPRSACQGGSPHLIGVMLRDRRAGDTASGEMFLSRFKLYKMVVRTKWRPPASDSFLAS